MELSWDSTKRSETLRQRALDFADAASLFAHFHLQQADDRVDYGEVRWLAVGAVDDMVLVVVWTQRSDSRRIISMRKANAKETARYRDALDRSR